MKVKLKNGDVVSELNTEDIWGKEVTIPSQNQWLYLSFHRFADCPFCVLRTNELIQNHAQFQAKNVGIVSIWPSSKERLLRHSETPPPLAIVSDESKVLYTAYGVTHSSIWGGIKLMFHPKLMRKAMKTKKGKMVVDADPKLMPASFLIDPEGTVRMVYYGKHYGDHPSIESILELVPETSSR